VPFRFEFADYNCQELGGIGELQLSQQSIEPTATAKEWMNDVIMSKTGCCTKAEMDSGACAGATRDNGNGRAVRNILEGALRSMSVRAVAASQGGQATRQLVTELQEVDIAAVGGQLVAEALRGACKAANQAVPELEKLCTGGRILSVSSFKDLLQKSREDCAGATAVLEGLRSTTSVVDNAMDIEISDPKVKTIFDELDEYIGLLTVKRTMREMFTTVQFAQLRKQQGLEPLKSQSFHMRFLGNPGTGKTVVARVVGKLLVALGAIEKPSSESDWMFAGGSEDDEPIFIEVSRSDLVAEYVGQTANKTQHWIKESLGGVFFLDEAYALVQGPKDTFGREAVDTLIKEMEDNRKHLIVILAGYNKEMEDFFNSNPGFRSRVPFTFNFMDYTCPELVKIGQLQLKGKGMELADGESCEHDTACWWTSRSVQMATQCCDKASLEDCSEGGAAKENRANGNGRTVRNILEASYRQMALRVLKKYTPQQLQAFAEKVPSFPEMHCSPRSDLDAGDYHGPDIRCDFTLLDGADLANATVEMVNMNLAPCKKTVQVKEVQALANGGAWLEVAKLIAVVSEKRIEGGKALDKACSAVMEMVSASVHPVLLELNRSADVKAEALVAVSQHVAARVRSNSAVLAKKVPGYDYVGNPGQCQNQRFRPMKANKDQRLSLMQCGAECMSDEMCTGFDHIDSIAKCHIYYTGIPTYAGGRASARCYRKSELPPGAGTFTPPPPGPTLPRPISHTPRRRRTFSPGGIGMPGKPDQSEIDDNRVDGKTPAVDEIMDELNSLVGLLKVKAGMTELHAMVEFDANRKAILPEAKSLMGQSFHMQFLGNPGTGKTVVARIVGRLLVEMGVIIGLENSKGEKQVVFEEVSRADLVAQYTGQTAPKVEAVVTSGLGGVLFIDEAYAIVRDAKDNFGQEAVDTLIKEMEDKRDQIVVILAGYETEMDTFFDSNPGFKSRVPLTFRFEDYSCTELSKIQNLVLGGSGIEVPAGMDTKLSAMVSFSTGCCEDIAAPDCHPSRENGNGRTVRNVVEALSRAMASRVMQAHQGKGTTPSMEELQYLAFEDVTMVAEEAAEIKLGIPCGHNGLVQQLYQSMSQVGGLRSWYLENRRLADPIDALFKILNDYDTMSKAMTEFGSEKLDRLSGECKSGIDGMIERLKSAGEEMCGVDGSEGTLDSAAAQLDEAQSNSAFHGAMAKVEKMAMEIILFKRIVKLNGDHDELPAALQSLIPVAAHCVDKLEGMRSKKVLVELSEALNVLAEQVS